MDPIHIHHLLRQLANEVKCPHCNARVRPDMIGVENFHENFCLLKISCHACGELFHGHAHVGVRVLPPEGDGQLAAQIESSAAASFSPPPVSEQDIAAVHAALHHPEASAGKPFSFLQS